MLFNRSTLLCLLFLILVTASKCKNVHPSVIIIGAGPAGIAAASKLYKSNFTNIKILEVQKVIGGRIKSVKFGKSFVDLGAEWYDGDHYNHIFKTAKDLNLIEVAESNETYYHSSGKTINLTLIKELQGIFNEIYHSPIQTSDDVVIGDYVQERYLKYVVNKYSNSLEKLQLAKDFLNVIKKVVLLNKGAFSWDQPSANNDCERVNQGVSYNWKDRGFKTILDLLLERIPDSTKELPINIIFNKEVNKISWFDQVSVECSDGSTYKADYIILTVSLGVLKRHKANLFYPRLPQEKERAIENLGFSAISKIFFHFPSRWWPEKDFYGIDFFWADQDKEEFLKKNKDKSWLLDLMGVYPTQYNPNVLRTWFCGESVPEIESLSDEAIIDGLMLILNKFTKNHFYTITAPDSLLRFNWYKNPHFYGTYSYETVNSRVGKVSAQVALSNPLRGKDGNVTLLFAGEATNPVHYGTVYGALETGFREATRIINSHNYTKK